MKWFRKDVQVICFLLLFAGCKRSDHTVERHVNVISDAPVSIKDTPPQPTYNPSDWKLSMYIGNINLISRLMHIEDSYGCKLLVIIKKTDYSEWEKIDSLNEPHIFPSYHYDPLSHEVRFQNCAQGWGYVVYLLNVNQ